MRYLLGLSLVVACGGSDPAVDAQADGAPDAPVDAVAVDGPIRDGPIRDGPIRDGPTRDGPTRDGPISDVRRLSMMSGLLMPTSTAQATLFGFDLDGRANDGVDNQLGTLLASFTNIAPELSIPEAVTTAVDRGRVLSLVELRADDLVDDPAAVVRVHVGEQPDPPACSSAADVVCRRHFGGDATVELATGVMPGAPLAGQLVSGTLTLSVADGELTLPFALGDRPAGYLHLQRAQLSLRIGSDGVVLDGKVGGAVTRVDFDTVVVPQLHAHFADLVGRDCDMIGGADRCGCGAGTAGATVMGFFDADGDCVVEVDEVQARLAALTSPDLDLDGDGVSDARSIGLGVTGVAVSFPEPP